MKQAILFCSLLVAVGVPSLSANEGEEGKNDKAIKEDLALVQGAWERMLQDGQGNTYRVTKEIKGDKETITYFGQDDKAVHAHTVDFKLERWGKVKIFTYSNMVITAGPHMGEKHPGPFSYVYKVDKDTFFEVIGAMLDDPRPVESFAWKRIK
jgi:hypothetical protein